MICLSFDLFFVKWFSTLSRWHVMVFPKLEFLNFIETPVLYTKDLLLEQPVLLSTSIVFVHQKYCTKHKALHAILRMRILVLRGFPLVYLIFRACLISQIFKGNIYEVNQGSKLRPIRSPTRLNFSPWRLKLLLSRQFGDLNFVWFRSTIKQ